MFKIFTIYRYSDDLKLLLYSNIGIVLGKTLINTPRRSSSKRRYLYFETKNQIIVHLIKHKRKSRNTNYYVPITNRANYYLSNQERQKLKLGLYYGFVDKIKDFWRFLAAKIKSLVDIIKGS